MGEAQWDVVNLRMGSGSVVAWPLLYKRIWSTLRPGGWVEQWEIDFEPRSDIKSLSDTPLHQWYQQIRFATAASGRPIDHCAGQTQMWLRQAGFKAISHQEIVLPLNQWNQDASDPAAVWYAMAYFEIIESMCVGPLRKVFCLTEKEVHSIIFHARQQVLDRTVPTFYAVHIYKAQKR